MTISFEATDRNNCTFSKSMSLMHGKEGDLLLNGEARKRWVK